jgi:diguanylate cyclase (GGDEF)-like protein
MTGEEGRGVRGWKVWALPRPVLLTVLTVQLAAVVLVAFTGVTDAVTERDLARFGILLLFGLLVGEFTRYIEQMRRRLSDTPHVNMSSVTILAITLVAGPFLGALATMVLYGHLWRRAWRWAAGLTVYRATFNASGMILSACAAAGVAHLFGDERMLDVDGPGALAGLGLVITTFWVTNSVLVGLVIAVAEGERSIVRLVGPWGENALEIVTLCLGAMTAALMQWRPLLAVFVVPLVYVLHRSASVQHLEVAASTDSKTGLLNMRTWQCLADRGLDKAHRRGTSVALLMADLDYFKRVNDTYGHPVGDQVLCEVADVIRRQVRLGDLVGRFGGEEFVVFLSDVTHDGAVEVAERIRRAVRATRIDPSPSAGQAGTTALALSVSIGVASDASGGRDLTELMAIADSAAYMAKQRGRDYVAAAKP